MSSNARKTPPPGVLSHPAIQALISQAQPSGSVAPDDVRRATEDAGVEARDLKALMTHLAGLGISVAMPVAARGRGHHHEEDGDGQDGEGPRQEGGGQDRREGRAGEEGRGQDGRRAGRGSGGGGAG